MDQQTSPQTEIGLSNSENSHSSWEGDLLGKPEEATTTLGRVLLGWLGVALLVAVIQYYYAERRARNLTALVVILLGWVGPFSIAYYVPLDLSSTLYRACEGEVCEKPYFYTSIAFQFHVWEAIYWTLFFLTWTAIPILQSYLGNGGFTFWQKWKRAWLYMSYYYLGVGIVGIVGLIYLVSTRGWMTFTDLKALVMALSNAYGLLLVLLFMGHGLVAVPRALWQKSDDHSMIRSIERKAPRVKENLDFANQELQDVAKEVSLLNRRIIEGEELRPYVDRLVQKCPVPGGPVSPTTTNLQSQRSIKAMMDLHYRLIKVLKDQRYCQYRWDHLLHKAFRYHDVQRNKSGDRRIFVSTYRPQRPGLFAPITERFEWHWYVWLRKPVYRGLAMMLAAMSLLLLWSETTMNVTFPKLSIIGLAINSDILGYHSKELVSYVAISYMCFCTYSSLLKLRFFNLYRLVPNHHTEERSFLFFAAYLTRCTFPLCYNFLNLTQNEKTSFQMVMGKINLVPLLGEGFNSWLPVMLIAITAMSFFNLHSRVLRLLQINALFLEDDDNDVIDLEDGALIIERALALAEREQQGQIPAVDNGHRNLPVSVPRSRHLSAQGRGGNQPRVLGPVIAESAAAEREWGGVSGDDNSSTHSDQPLTIYSSVPPRRDQEPLSTIRRAPDRFNAIKRNYGRPK